MYLVPNAFGQFSYSPRVRQLPRDGARDGEEHPPEPIEGGLIVHWMTRVRGDFVMGDRLGELRATWEDEKSVKLCGPKGRVRPNVAHRQFRATLT